MIRPNVPVEDHEEFSYKARTSEFAGILTALRPFWDQYMADLEAHTAKGMLATRKGLAYAADVSFDDQRKYMRLIVRLPFNNHLDTPRLYALLQLQRRTQGLATLIFDAESRVLLLVSRSVLPTVTVADKVVARVVTDAVRVLEDDALKNLMN